MIFSLNHHQSQRPASICNVELCKPRGQLLSPPAVPVAPLLPKGLSKARQLVCTPHLLPNDAKVYLQSIGAHLPPVQMSLLSDVRVLCRPVRPGLPSPQQQPAAQRAGQPVVPQPRPACSYCPLQATCALAVATAPNVDNRALKGIACF